MNRAEWRLTGNWLNTATDRVPWDSPAMTTRGMPAHLRQWCSPPPQLPPLTSDQPGSLPGVSDGNAAKLSPPHIKVEPTSRLLTRGLQVQSHPGLGGTLDDGC